LTAKYAKYAERNDKADWRRKSHGQLRASRVETLISQFEFRVFCGFFPLSFVAQISIIYAKSRDATARR
jgi:hypothetical protein